MRALTILTALLIACEADDGSFGAADDAQGETISEAAEASGVIDPEHCRWTPDGDGAAVGECLLFDGEQPYCYLSCGAWAWTGQHSHYCETYWKLGTIFACRAACCYGTYDGSWMSPPGPNPWLPL